MKSATRLRGYAKPILLSVCLYLTFCLGGVDGFRFPQVEEDEDRLPQTFDFIVVGGGTAGCVLASRLSEQANGKFSVLLLEAGGVPPEFMNVPAFSQRGEVTPELTFQYQSVPQRHAALGVNGGIVNIPLGRVLGGTSMINHNMFNRGNPHDFDNWANLTGDRSWEYANMLKYFKKSETYLGEFPSTIHHGFNGPIPVSKQNYAPGKEAFLAAGEELGFPIRDPNGPQQISFTPIEYSRRNGRRVGSYKGYLESVVNSRGNLRIVTNAFVTKVLFDGATAVGVKFNQNGTSPQMGKVAIAKREIILSAGAYNSATLLMRSGIGPRNDLQAAGIPIIKELPVGKNFQEHPIVPIHIMLNNKSLSFDPITDLNPETWEQFQRYGEGPYTTVGGFAAQAYLTSTRAINEGQSNWPDIQLRLASTNTRQSQFQNNYVAPWETSVIMSMYLARPKSRGSVKLNPADVNGMPIIDFNYLADPRDVEVYLDAVKATLKIFERTKTYQRLGARIFREPLPKCGHFPFRSKAYWRCYIRQTTLPGNHPTGTCSMNSVVDSKLRVIGIKGLRVVDASIMPFITNTNLHAAVYGIAEKASDSILRDHGGSASSSLSGTINTGNGLLWNGLDKEFTF